MAPVGCGVHRVRGSDAEESHGCQPLELRILGNVASLCDVGSAVVESGRRLRRPNIQTTRHVPSFGNERHQQRLLGDAAAVESFL